MKTFNNFMEQKKCPAGMKWDSNLKDCVPSGKIYGMRWWGVGRHQNGENGNGKSGNGHANGNGHSGNGNGNGGNGGSNGGGNGGGGNGN